MFETQHTNRTATTPGVTLMRPVSNLFLQGFGQEQVAGLVKTRDRFPHGDLSELTTEDHRRLLFARWLMEHGRLRD